MEFIVLAIPVFFLLIGIELLVQRLKKSALYRFNDAVTNISCGIGQQVIGVFLKTAVVLLYFYIHEHYRLFDISNAWWVWIVLFIGVDFFYYWFHRLAHEISIMWGSHVVHHQSEEYNFSVALRQGWIQSLFSMMFYLPLAFAGFDPVMFIIVSQFQTLYQFWIHTKTINKLPAPIEYIFNTPSHHRVHHGVQPKYIDKNHGGTLIIFDRMFGTFQAEEEEVVYGITKQPKSWNPLWLNFEYWIDLFKDFRRAKKWSDKWKILFKPPGWKPDDLGGIEKPKEVSVDTFEKYDTQVSAGLNYYVLFQYVVLLIGASVFLFWAGGMETVREMLFEKLMLAGLIIVAVVSLGGIFEMKPWTPYLEISRLIATTAAVLYMLHNSPNFVLIAIGVGLVSLVSLVWFSRYVLTFRATGQLAK